MQVIHDLDPTTGETIATIPMATQDEVHAAVARARAAQPGWQALGAEQRVELIVRAAEALGANADEVARLITSEMGKPAKSARSEAEGWVAGAREAAQEARTALEPVLYSENGAETYVVRDPLGVVAAITPWNYPVGMVIDLVIPALVTGNTVVFKPSEHVPLVGAAIADAFRSVLPEGTLELVQGDGSVGAELVAADVDMIGFVGSRATGQSIMRAASGGLKRLVLELGGKDPLIVFADADLDAAAETATRHSLRNTGQVCCSVERVYVEASVADEFERRVLEKAREWTYGDPTDASTKMGPMVSREQRAKVEALVADAVTKGARCLIGGVTPEGPGAFYPATVLAGITREHSILSEETFGPVVSLATFDGSEAEAVRLANDTHYGLGANVYSGDRERAVRVASQIRSGQVGVNRYLSGSSKAPWVGARQSGFGFLGGVEGARQFTVPKSISVALG
ncbi:MAG: aldehyde dehydrogenase family protein [Planctomycetota bacterium]